MLYVRVTHDLAATGRRVWLVRNGDGGVTVLDRDFPGAFGCSEVPDTPANREAGALGAAEILSRPRW